MKKTIIIAVLLVCALGIAGCSGGNSLQKDDPFGESTEQVTTKFVSPVTTCYAVGSQLNLRGGSLTVEDETMALAENMLDQTSIPTFDQPGTYTITGSYKGTSFSFAVTVYDGVEFRVDESVTKVTRACDFSRLITIRQVDEEGNASDWYPISRNDISAVEVRDGKVYATVKVTVNGITREKTFAFALDDSSLTVEELKNAAVGQEYVVKGVVAAIATTVTYDEVLIADKATGEMISIYNLTNGGKVTLRTLDIDVEVGDEIVIPVVLQKSDKTASDGKETADRGKLVARYIGCKQVSTAILSKENAIAFRYDQVTEITGNSGFKAYLAKANRENIMYRIVKLTGSMDFVYYGSSRQIKFCFSDLKPSSLTSFRLDGTSATPVFCDGAVQYTAGKSFSELVFGDPKFFTGSSSDNLSSKATRKVELYALYIGGNQWYHQFVILSADDVKVLQGKG